MHDVVALSVSAVRASHAPVKSYANGSIRGVLTASGTYRFTMRFTDGDRATAQKNFTITVKAGTLKAPAPRVSGSARVGHTLKAVPGAWTGKARLSYRWYANGKAIARATGKTLHIGAALKGKRITVNVTGTKPGYTKVTKASKPTAAVRR